MANWWVLFRSWFLEHGQKYFECGQVVELEDDGDLVRARSAAPRSIMWRYGVLVNEWTGMSSDCLYADKDEKYKHTEAVLFALEERAVQQHSGCRFDWQAALDKLPEEQMRELLRNMTEEDGSLLDRIVRLASGPGTGPSQWQVDLEQIILLCSPQSGRQCLKKARRLDLKRLPTGILRME